MNHRYSTRTRHVLNNLNLRQNISADATTTVEIKGRNFKEIEYYKDYYKEFVRFV
jgi:hypothetical protein